jgi:hypothetical protein
MTPVLRAGDAALVSGRGRLLYRTSHSAIYQFGERVIALHGPGIAMFPFSAVLDNAQHFPETLISDGSMFEGEGLIFRIERTESFAFRATCPPSDTLLLLRYLRPVRYSISSAFFPEPDDATVLERNLRRHFIASLHQGSAEAVLHSVLATGFGLTPSGDDFALGFISVMNLCGHDMHSFRELFSSHPLPLSRSLLLCALEHQYPEPLIHALHGICEHRTSIQPLLSTGHTSGMDVLAGMVYASLLLNCKNIGDVETIFD